MQDLPRELLTHIMNFLEPKDQLALASNSYDMFAASQETGLPVWSLAQLLRKEKSLEKLRKQLLDWSATKKFDVKRDLTLMCCCTPLMAGVDVGLKYLFVEVIKTMITKGISEGPIIGSLFFGGFSLLADLSLAVSAYTAVKYFITRRRYNNTIQEIQKILDARLDILQGSEYSENRFEFLNQNPHLKRLPLIHSFWSRRQAIVDQRMQPALRVVVEEIEEEARPLNQASSSYQTFSR